MTRTEFLTRLKKAAQLQAEKKRQQQERFKDLVEKIRAAK